MDPRVRLLLLWLFCLVGVNNGDGPCYLVDAIDTARKIAAIASKFQELFASSHVGIGVFAAVADSFVRYGCCDSLLVQEARRRAESGGSQHDWRLLGMVLDHCYFHNDTHVEVAHGDAAAAFAIAAEIHVNSTPCGHHGAWKTVPIHSFATELLVTMPSHAFFDGRGKVHVVGDTLLNNRLTYHDRALRILELSGADLRLSWDDSFKSSFPFDLATCMVFRSDKWPDEPISVSLKQHLIVDKVDAFIDFPLLILPSTNQVYFNYFHFLTELVSKLQYFFAAETQVPKLARARIALPVTLAGSHLFRQLLPLLPLEGRIYWLPSFPFLMHPSSVVVVAWDDVPERAWSQSTHDQVYFVPSLAILPLRQLFLNQDNTNQHLRALRVILVHREGRTRSLPSGFEGDVCQHLNSHSHWDAVIFDGAKQALHEQAVVFQSASAVLGGSGAGLTNIIFMPEQSALIFLPCLDGTSFFVHLATLLIETLGLLQYGMYVLSDAATPYHAPYIVSMKWCMQLSFLWDTLSRLILGIPTQESTQICIEHATHEIPGPCGLLCLSEEQQAAIVNSASHVAVAFGDESSLRETFVDEFRRHLEGEELDGRFAKMSIMFRMLDKVKICNWSQVVVDFGAGDGASIASRERHGVECSEELMHCDNLDQRTLDSFRGCGGLEVELLNNLHHGCHRKNLFVSAHVVTTYESIMQSDMLGNALEHDFLKVNIDAHDCAVLLSIFGAGYRPKIIRVEVNIEIPLPLEFGVHLASTCDNRAEETGLRGCSIATVSSIGDSFSYGIVAVDLPNHVVLSHKEGVNHASIPYLTAEDAMERLERCCATARLGRALVGPLNQMHTLFYSPAFRAREFPLEAKELVVATVLQLACEKTNPWDAAKVIPVVWAKLSATRLSGIRAESTKFQACPIDFFVSVSPGGFMRESQKKASSRVSLNTQGRQACM